MTQAGVDAAANEKLRRHTEQPAKGAFAEVADEAFTGIEDMLGVPADRPLEGYSLPRLPPAAPRSSRRG